MAEITLKEAKELYNSSEEIKAFLLTKFTKEELEGKNIPTQEEFNKFFEDNILSQIDPTKTKFPGKNNFSWVRLFNSKNEWLFDYDSNTKNSYFWYSYNSVSTVFMNKFILGDNERHRLMLSVVEKYFNLHTCQPYQDLNPNNKEF